MNRIDLVAIMDYCLGSDNPEEFYYYKKIRKEMEDMKKYSLKKDIPQFFEINENKDK